MSASAPLSQAEVVRVLKESPIPLTCREVILRLGVLQAREYDYEIKRNNVWCKLRTLAKQGYVEKIPCGDIVKWRLK